LHFYISFLKTLILFIVTTFWVFLFTPHIFLVTANILKKFLIIAKLPFYINFLKTLILFIVTELHPLSPHKRPNNLMFNQSLWKIKEWIKTSFIHTRLHISKWISSSFSMLVSIFVLLNQLHCTTVSIYIVEVNLNSIQVGSCKLSLHKPLLKLSLHDLLKLSLHDLLKLSLHVHT